MELDAGETSLRVSRARRGEYVPDSSVGMAKASLGLSDADLTTPEARQRLSELLGTQWLLIGTIRPSAQSPGQVEVELQFQGSEPSAAMNPISESFAPDDLLAASGRLGEQLRTALGVSLSGKEVEQLRAMRLSSSRRRGSTPRVSKGSRAATTPGPSKPSPPPVRPMARFTRRTSLKPGPGSGVGTVGGRAKPHCAPVRQLRPFRRASNSSPRRSCSSPRVTIKLTRRQQKNTLRDLARRNPDLAQEFVGDSSVDTTLERGFAVLARWRKAAGNREPHLFLQMAEAQLRNRAGDEKGRGFYWTRRSDAHGRWEHASNWARFCGGAAIGWRGGVTCRRFLRAWLPRRRSSGLFPSPRRLRASRWLGHAGSWPTAIGLKP